MQLCPPDVDLDKYILHELLHIVVASAKDRDSEEICVQDICEILIPEK